MIRKAGIPVYNKGWDPCGYPGLGIPVEDPCYNPACQSVGQQGHPHHCSWGWSRSGMGTWALWLLSAPPAHFPAPVPALLPEHLLLLQEHHDPEARQHHRGRAQAAVLSQLCSSSSSLHCHPPFGAPHHDEGSPSPPCSPWAAPQASSSHCTPCAAEDELWAQPQAQQILPCCMWGLHLLEKSINNL